MCAWSTRPPIIGCGWQETNARNGVVFSIWGRSYGAFLQSKLRVYLWENPLALLLVKGSCSWWIMIIQHLKNRSNMIIFFSHLCTFQASISKSINLFIPNQLASLNLRCIAPKLPWHGLVECWWADWSVPLAHLVVTDLSDPPNPRRGSRSSSDEDWSQYHHGMVSYSMIWTDLLQNFWYVIADGLGL